MATERPGLSVGFGVELREWLEANHDSSDGVWLVVERKNTSGPYLGWGEIVDEPLAFGWIARPGESRRRQRGIAETVKQAARAQWRKTIDIQWKPATQP